MVGAHTIILSKNIHKSQRQIMCGCVVRIFMDQTLCKKPSQNNVAELRDPFVHSSIFRFENPFFSQFLATQNIVF